MLKWAKGLSEHASKALRTAAHTWKEAPTIITREVGYDLTPPTTAGIEKSENEDPCQQRCCWWDCKGSHCGNRLPALQTVTESPPDAAVLCLEIYPREMRNVSPDVHSSSIHDSQNVETTQACVAEKRPDNTWPVHGTVFLDHRTRC